MLILGDAARFVRFVLLAIRGSRKNRLMNKTDFILFSCVVLALLSSSCAYKGKEYHVSPTGNDINNGTIRAPFQTISAAARIAKAGDTITVHQGVYREYVNPARGGKSESERIVYRAAPGEHVVIKGSERITTWKDAGNGVWKVELPNSFFKKYNPYRRKIGWVTENWLRGGKWTHCGDVYLNGEAFREKRKAAEVSSEKNSWHTAAYEFNTYIWANFGDLNPNKELTEINVRESIIYPENTPVNYITIRGFTMMHAASPWASPSHYQSGAVGTNGGHHWIVENCAIINAKTNGFSMGIPKKWTAYNEYDFAGQLDYNRVGHHIIRNNIFRRCGQSGIVGNQYNTASYIAGNYIAETSYRREFWGVEPSAIKFHNGVDLVLENNHIAESNNCYGLWIDAGNQNIRVTRNFIGALLFIEANHGPVLVDNNVITGGFTNWVSEAHTMAHNLLVFEKYRHGREDRPVGYYKPHSLETAGVAKISYGDERWYNNIFIKGGLDSSKRQIRIHPQRMLVDGDFQPLAARGCDADYNLFLSGAKKSQLDENSIVSDHKIQYSIQDDGNLTIDLEINLESAGIKCPLITSDFLGFYKVPQQAMENPDGSGIILDHDILGKPRNRDNPGVGPFAGLKHGKNRFRIFSITDKGPQVNK
jgi:alpha-N-arabinofuranosidase